MDKKKKELLITIGLAVVFILAIGNSIKFLAGKNKQAVNPAAHLPSVAVTPAPVETTANVHPRGVQEGLAAGSQAQPQKAAGVFERDPFKRQSDIMISSAGQKQNSKKSNKTGAFLTGIVYDKNNPGQSYCIINGEPLKIGESSEGITVIDIKEDFITVKNEKEGAENENIEQKLYLWEEPEAY